MPVEQEKNGLDLVWTFLTQWAEPFAAVRSALAGPATAGPVPSAPPVTATREAAQ